MCSLSGALAVCFICEQRPVRVGLVGFLHILLYFPDDVRVLGGNVLLFARVFFQIV